MMNMHHPGQYHVSGHERNDRKSDIHELRSLSPRRPREINRLFRLLDACGARLKVQYLAGAPFIEWNNRRVIWDNDQKAFVLLHGLNQVGTSNGGVGAALFILEA